MQQLRNEMNKQRKSKSQYEVICNYIFMHGNANHKNCRLRHVLLPSDILNNENAFVNKELRFHLIKVISPTEYIVRPLKIRTGNVWDEVNGSNEFLGFNMRFSFFYSLNANLKCVETIELGQLCVVVVNDAPHRGQIIQIHEEL